MSLPARFAILLVAGTLWAGSTKASGPPEEKTERFFREDWKETPPEVPVTQAHVRNPDVLVTRHGPGGDSIKKSHHAEISKREGTYWLEDLGSTNGTYVGNQRLRSAHPLEDGEQISLGGVLLIFRARA